MNCLVLEDQQIFLDLLASMVESFNEISNVFKAESIEAASNISHHHKIDLAILDVYLPDGHCNDLAHHLTFQNPDTKIIILSGAAQEFVCPKNLEQSIYGIIDKNDAFDTLRHCINVILKPAHHELTQRQQTIFGLIGEGKTTKEIAMELGIAHSTIETHRKAIAQRLNVSGAELIRRAALARTIQKIN
jgi:DNA-binding NarL/FixJ family response regulator